MKQELSLHSNSMQEVYNLKLRLEQENKKMASLQEQLDKTKFNLGEMRSENNKLIEQFSQ